VWLASGSEPVSAVRLGSAAGSSGTGVEGAEAWRALTASNEAGEQPAAGLKVLLPVAPALSQPHASSTTQNVAHKAAIPRAERLADTAYRAEAASWPQCLW
jgi:hypothetical protein